MVRNISLRCYWYAVIYRGEYPELGKPPVPPVRPSKANTGSSKGKPFGVGASVSSAMDARLDLRVDHLAHVRLRVGFMFWCVLSVFPF